MKKLTVFLMTLSFAFTLAACSGKKPTATIESENIKRSSYSFDLKVDDKDMVTKGSVLVNFYKITKKDESLVSTKTLSTFSETVSVTGLDSNTDYRADVLCTYNKKSHIIYSWTFKTNEKGTEFDPIVITTFKELVDNIANDYSSDAYYELANDLDFTDYKDEEGKAIDFSGMSTTSSTSFQGHLDGKGYSIKNVTLTSSQTYNGIFGYLKGTIKNLKIENANVEVTRETSTTTYSGILCGYGYQAKLVDVDIIDSKLNVSAKTQYTGGIAGYGFATNFNYCDTDNVEITSSGSSTAYVGGITSYLCQNSSNKYGKIYSSTVDEKITISKTQTLYYGGLVGLVKAGASIDCGLANVEATINGYGLTKAGGVVGQANLNSSDDFKSIKNVVAKGNITFKSIKETDVIECNDDIFIGGLIGTATAVYLDGAYSEMNIDIEAKAKENKKIYSGLAFGNGYESHTELHNSIINGSVTAVTTGSNDAAEISIHGYDGATYIDADSNEKPLSTIDSETVKYVKIELDIDGVSQNYPSPISISDAKSVSGWDLNIWDVTVNNDKLDIKFKNE